MTLDEAFAALETCAAVGARCPVNSPPGAFPSALISKLARQGKIRIEVMQHNWRAVTILKGPHAGKHTALPPKGRSTPYLVIDTRGTTRGDGTPALLPHTRRKPAPVTLRKFSWDESA